MRLSLRSVLSFAMRMSLLTVLAIGTGTPGLSTHLLPAINLLTAQRANALAAPFLDKSSLASTEYVFLPILNRALKPVPWIDPSDRQISLDYFNQVYLASENVSIDWTGDHESCDAGETAMAFKEAVGMRINYFRAMAGVPATVQLSTEYSRKAQQAALMMSINGQLSHNPPPSWLCYTSEGAEAAGSSNLFLGIYGPAAITGYIYDPGNGNYAVGHRRWILYPQTEWMGSGDIPSTGGYMSSNALWVFDENMWTPRPQTRDEYVAWPPPGYVPYQVVFPRWSFAIDEADFSNATVEMSSGGQSIPVTVQPVVTGYGENTLVWEPDLSFGAPPPSDITYDVLVSGVKIGGVPQDFTYQVIIFDPGSLNGIKKGIFSGRLNEPALWVGNR
jgi:hypothetical protein